MMVIAVISLGVPSFFNRMFGGQDILREQAMLNIGLAIVLLIGYGLYLFFMIKTHPEFFKSSTLQKKKKKNMKIAGQRAKQSFYLLVHLF